MSSPYVELTFNPTDLRPRDLPKIGEFLGSPANAIEAALVAARLRMVEELRTEVRGLSDPTTAQLLRAADLAWQAVFWRYRKVSAPVMADAYVRAYRAAGAGDVPMSVIYDLADKHAEKIGDYFHDSSRDALAEGFNTMVNRRIPAKAAADRVLDAYGLTPRQMRGYTSNKQFAVPVESVSPFDVKARARSYIDKSFTQRIKKLSEQEEHNIDQQAQQFAWMWMQDKGQLNEKAEKLWITAKDERVCPVCGPLHGQKVGINEQFRSSQGKFWTPGLHPNCRCVVRLIENRFSKAWEEKEHPRAEHGRFSAVSRKSEPYEITQDDREHYVNERCNDLALVIHQRTGWPVWGVFTTNADDEREEAWWHTGVITPDGQWLDVLGKRELGEVADEWSEYLYNEGDVDLDPVQDFGKDDGSEVTPRAKKIADALLAEHQIKKDDWEPKLHPRGGDPHNRGRFSRVAERDQKPVINIAEPDVIEQAPTLATISPSVLSSVNLGGKLATISSAAIAQSADTASIPLATVSLPKAKIDTPLARIEAPQATIMGLHLPTPTAPVVTDVTVIPNKPKTKMVPYEKVEPLPESYYKVVTGDPSFLQLDKEDFSADREQVIQNAVDTREQLINEVMQHHVANGMVTYKERQHPYSVPLEARITETAFRHILEVLAQQTTSEPPNDALVEVEYFDPEGYYTDPPLENQGRTVLDIAHSVGVDPDHLRVNVVQVDSVHENDADRGHAQRGQIAGHSYDEYEISGEYVATDDRPEHVPSAETKTPVGVDIHYVRPHDPAVGYREMPAD